MSTRLHSAPNHATSLHPTQNDLPEKARRKMVELLNQLLADVCDLHTQVKQAHWNVKGSNFIAFHKFLDKVYNEVGEAMDEIAERAVQLGGTALGTARVAARKSRLPEYDLEITDCADHVAALSAAVAEFGHSIRTAIENAEDCGDADTADLFTQVSRTMDKNLWMIEAHNQGH